MAADRADDSGEGAWIFVSHSHRDLREVRRIRDALEAKGHQPLLFFLKCLGDDAEIDDLIRREIEARQFFLLCDSPNARTSRWVQQELQLIKDLGGKVRVELALDDDWQSQLEAVDELSRRATIFISWSVRSSLSKQLVPRLADALRAHDYQVFFDMPVGVEWLDQTRGAIDTAIERGFVLALLSPEVLSAESVTGEVHYALERAAQSGTRSSIIPIIVSERELTYALLRSSPIESIRDIQFLDFTEGEIEDNVDRLVALLASR